MSLTWYFPGPGKVFLNMVSVFLLSSSMGRRKRNYWWASSSNWDEIDGSADNNASPPGGGQQQDHADEFTWRRTHQDLALLHHEGPQQQKQYQSKVELNIWFTQYQAWNVNWETRHMMIQFEDDKNVIFQVRRSSLNPWTQLTPPCRSASLRTARWSTSSSAATSSCRWGARRATSSSTRSSSTSSLAGGLEQPWSSRGWLISFVALIILINIIIHIHWISPSPPQSCWLTWSALLLWPSWYT